MVPRARLLHTKIWSSDQFLRLTPTERLLYIGLITFGDDQGRLRGDARFLKHQFFPDDPIDTKKIEKMRNAICASGLIEVYIIENTFYISHPRWTKYQKLRPDRMKESEYPAPPSDTCPTNDGQVTAEGKGKEDKKIEVSATEGSASEANARDGKVEEGKSAHRESMLKALREQRASSAKNHETKTFSFSKIDAEAIVSRLSTNEEDSDPSRSPTPPFDN